MFTDFNVRSNHLICQMTCYETLCDAFFILNLYRYKYITLFSVKLNPRLTNYDAVIVSSLPPLKFLQNIKYYYYLKKYS